MPNTFDDFWSMVWQENSRVIGMLNSTKQKPVHTRVQYVSSKQDHLILKEFLPMKESIRVKPQYIRTTLTIVYKQIGELRAIHHFKYLDWSETEFLDPELFLDFLLEVNKQNQQYFMEAFQTSLLGTIVIYGEAGGEKTSVYIVHIYGPLKVLKVRQQQNFSTQTPNHYIFINNVILFFLVPIQSNITMFLEFRSHLTNIDAYLLLLL